MYVQAAEAPPPHSPLITRLKRTLLVVPDVIHGCWAELSFTVCIECVNEYVNIV